MRIIKTFFFIATVLTSISIGGCLVAYLFIFLPHILINDYVGMQYRDDAHVCCWVFQIILVLSVIFVIFNEINSEIDALEENRMTEMKIKREKRFKKMS